ncbi:39S ribosomal protein L16, mitochondrial [Liparis tanakae]|uniref:Large ribosomal subunit protein uL16m n=1 Tax=Liparis tanakae TaxID=230148 RepID=A0A4Z2HNC8_9TELE|nr:39S ribosomal protein L16, mitochondrial [Liparis tanakae]
MFSFIKAAVGGLTGICRAHGHQQGLLHSHFKVLAAGLKTLEIPPDFTDMVLPEKPKLKFMNKVPNFKKAKKEMKNLRDIQGPARAANDFTTGQYAIVALGGGYLHWGHIEMIRLTVNRKMDPQTTFARWRINGPYKPITRKGLGQRMGGGKGAIDHYVTPIRYGRLIVMTRESLAALHKKHIDMEQNNQNPWTFKEIARGNMMGIRKVLSPLDMHNHGRFTGKFHLPWRV